MEPSTVSFTTFGCPAAGFGVVSSAAAAGGRGGPPPRGRGAHPAGIVCASPPRPRPVSASTPNTAATAFSFLVNMADRTPSVRETTRGDEGLRLHSSSSRAGVPDFFVTDARGRVHPGELLRARRRRCAPGLSRLPSLLHYYILVGSTLTIPNGRSTVNSSSVAIGAVTTSLPFVWIARPAASPSPATTLPSATCRASS